jgi:hypothetical protein
MARQPRLRPGGNHRREMRFLWYSSVGSDGAESFRQLAWNPFSCCHETWASYPTLLCLSVPISKVGKLHKTCGLHAGNMHVPNRNYHPVCASL